MAQVCIAYFATSIVVVAYLIASIQSFNVVPRGDEYTSCLCQIRLGTKVMALIRLHLPTKRLVPAVWD